MPVPHAVDSASFDGSVDERIAGAALGILRSRGPVAVTIEAVAAASGVAKTTIYRRHENRGALLRAVVNSTPFVLSIPPGLTAYETLHWFLTRARETIEDVVGRGTVAAILLDSDPEFSGLLLDMIKLRTKPLRDDLRALSRTGELRRDLDIELVLSLLLGTYVAEAIRGSDSDEGWADAVLSLLWPALTGE